jgi:uncharacterized membrane protein YdjX (TVP38/TMEM64 family)
MKIIIAIVISLLLIYTHLALVQHERNECHKWIEEYHTYSDYYFVDYQVMQCQALTPELLIGE